MSISQEKRPVNLLAVQRDLIHRSTCLQDKQKLQGAKVRVPLLALKVKVGLWSSEEVAEAVKGGETV